VVILISCFIVVISLTNAQYRALQVLFRRVKERNLRLQDLTSVIKVKYRRRPVWDIFILFLLSMAQLINRNRTTTGP
jgi:hypothetical protein